MKNFFISYNKADLQWAEWIAWELEELGYSTFLQEWDFQPGSNFVLKMDQATKQSERTIAVLSSHYLEAEYTLPEWAAAFAKDPTGLKGSLIPIRVKECNPNGLLSQIVYVDLVGHDMVSARRLLKAAVQQKRAKPEAAPRFPRTPVHSSQEPPVFPGTKRSINPNLRCDGVYLGKDNVALRFFPDGTVVPFSDTNLMSETNISVAAKSAYVSCGRLKNQGKLNKLLSKESTWESASIEYFVDDNIVRFTCGSNQISFQNMPCVVIAMINPSSRRVWPIQLFPTLFSVLQPSFKHDFEGYILETEIHLKTSIGSQRGNEANLLDPLIKTPIYDILCESDDILKFIHVS